jgi:hypothetical protein
VRRLELCVQLSYEPRVDAEEAAPRRELARAQLGNGRFLHLQLL